MTMLPLQATYRLQFHAGFTFADAARIVPYLHELGISHVYASPYLKAKAGSTHGYDVVDHGSLNPELGTAEDYQAFADALARHGMSHILDIVPNHVGVGTNENAWWNDVLAKGRASNYAGYFDIDWEAPGRDGKLFLPVLGGTYEEVRRRGELRAVNEDGRLFIAYYERRFPASEESATFLAAHGGIEAVNADAALLDAFVELQHYRLGWWRLASKKINYRRFFDINDLAALDQENPAVFAATHRLVLDLVRGGTIAGLRVDHPDGLYDPAAYFQRLRREAGEGCFIFAEKILALNEKLMPGWPIDGTTGYDFITLVNNLFVDPASGEALREIEQEQTGAAMEFENLAYQKKRLVLTRSFAGDLHALTLRLCRLARECGVGGELPKGVLYRCLLLALRETIACFAVYRTYITRSGVSRGDRVEIEIAVNRAMRRNPRMDPSYLMFIRSTLLQEIGPEGLRKEQAAFAGKFQQLTAPVTAKGVEDTAFYIDTRLLSLNEVGGDPGVCGLPPEQIHAAFEARQREYPRALSPLSTHDTKRSEDVRARLNVLSEMPDEWRAHVARWMALDPVAGIHPADRYFLLQTLVGAWPLGATEADPDFTSRIQAYMKKALREAKLRTSWIQPDEAYERMVEQCVAALLHDSAFVSDFIPFVQRVAEPGLVNSLAQTLLRLTAPGTPDTYQGTELWDFSLVDPDNRRRVDYALRQRLLSELPEYWPAEPIRSLSDPRIKLFVIHKALGHRRACPTLYTAGDYIPVDATGPGAQRVFAFLRRHGDEAALVVIPRLQAKCSRDERRQTHLSLDLGKGRWRNIFTGRVAHETAADQLVGDFPVALYSRTG